jgi:hypothetical protein
VLQVQQIVAGAAATVVLLLLLDMCGVYLLLKLHTLPLHYVAAAAACFLCTGCTGCCSVCLIFLPAAPAQLVSSLLQVVIKWMIVYSCSRHQNAHAKAAMHGLSLQTH